MVKIERRHNRYRLRYRDTEGRRRSLSFEERKDALIAKALIDGGCREPGDELRRTKAKRRSFAELVEQWVAHRGAMKRSYKSDRSILDAHLLPAFGSTPLRALSVEAIDAFAAGKPLKPKTIHNILTLLRTILRYGVDLGWLDRCPPFRKPKVHILDHEYRYLRTHQEIVRFLSAARQVDPSLYALYAAAVYTGMRAGELAGLLWQRVNLDRRLITVAASYDGPTKGGYVRHVPIVDALLPILKAWRVECPTPSDYVFPSSRGTMLRPSARVFQERLHQVLDHAGFERVKVGGQSLRYLVFHSLRHTFASHWVMNGGDLFKLQRIGGWRSQAMVQRYAHLAPDAFIEDYALFQSPTAEGELIRLNPKPSHQRRNR